MAGVFSLQVLQNGLATLTFDLASKKVNVFTLEVLAEFDALLTDLANRQDVRCLTILSAKPNSFIAGLDVQEIAGVTDPGEAEEGSRAGQRLFDRFSQLPFPKIAAIQGTCVGGGTELCLAGDYILISDREDIRIGLPEIRLGIVPAWGGCSRLPRRVGIAAALDIILAGKAVNSRRAYKIGLADAVIPDAVFRRQVRTFAERIIGGDKPSSRRLPFKQQLLEKNPVGRGVIFNQARKQVLERTGGHYPAPLRAIEVVKIGVSKGLAAGLEAEVRATGELAVSPVCKSLMHVYHMLEDAKHTPLPGEPSPVETVAVLGAGVMGGGIAQLIADKADLPVRLKDLDTGPLAKGMAHAEKLFQKQVKRRRLSKAQAKRKMSLLHPTLNHTGFARADLVIEAIVEDLEIKQEVFAQVADSVTPETILASNTSSLSIDSIGSKTPHQNRVAGMHFFNPVHRMPLVEVVRGKTTSDRVVSTLVAFCRQLGKTAVVVNNGPGFLVNRLLGFYMTEALWLLDDGCSVEDIDQAMTDWGMPMGPLVLIDEVGIDVGIKVAHILADALGDRLPVPGWAQSIPDSGHLGTKSGRGFYLYAGGKRKDPDPGIYKTVGNGPPHHRTDASHMVDRMVLPMVNEGARCLEEEIVDSAANLDLAMIMGTGFPPFRGGLCRWADQQGLAGLQSTLERLSAEVGDRFLPSDALERTNAAGGFYTRFG